MRVVKVNENGADRAKGSAELNQHVEDEKKEEVRDGVAGEGQGLSVEDEMRIVEAVKVNDMKETRGGDSDHPQVEIHRPQPQPQLHVVRWDKFLPVRSLKVLLVEYDDSTRHVVSALLRNCSYEVTAVSNGLEAWRILEDLNNQIDLVLTEVVMPGVSGIVLLSKIMSHKSRQNIPVIMMSSHDSMGMVLKCLSKGAVDFLVKPIRKNELKTLWQHVWRKCHSSSGSGSESGIRTEKSIRGKSVEESDNDSGSNDDDDTRSIGLQNRDGSDNGSGTQSSWTKRAAEAESPQPMSSWDQLADPPDSTCAQVIYPRREAFASSWVSAPMKEPRGPDNQLDDVSLGKDLEIGMPRNPDTHLKEPSKKGTTITSTEKNQPSLSDLNNDGQKFDKGKLEISDEKPKDDLTKQTKKLPGGIVSNYGHHRGSGSKTPAALPEIAKSKDKVLGNMKDLLSLDLSLKRLGEDAHTKTNAPEQNILRHSELSAFTRYNTGSTANQGQTGNVGSCSPVDDSSGAVKQSHSDTPPNQNSNSSSNNNDMGSTTYGSFTKPAAATDKVPAKSRNIKSSGNSSVFQPAQTDDASNPQLIVSGNNKACAGIVNVVPLQENDMHQPVQIHHHHHHHHHHVYSVQSLEQVPKHEDLSLKNMDETTPQCGSSDAGRVAVEANVVTNGSLNGSACGSNHESNMFNGSSAAVNAEGMTIGKDKGMTMKDGDDGSGTGSGVDVDHRSAQREAALNKFRQKRKERCFEKRVRYQSRKKLAEQRPRVRGQFVRHARETKGKEGDS